MSTEKLLGLLREAEPYLLDICKQGGFHAVSAGELHTRISNELFKDTFKDILKQEPDELIALRARVARLEDALKPFAEESYIYDPDEDDDNRKAFNSFFIIGQLRTARRALEEK